ncbi:MAG: ATP synthase F1 subunit gamma [bacterium]
MAQETRELKRRIRGITNTKKVTKAMEMMAASKMRRSVDAALASRDYALRAWEVLTNLSEVTDPNLHALLTKREMHKALIIVFTSDRGLAGGLNTQVIKKTLELVKQHPEATLEFITVGKKGQELLIRFGFPVIATFPAPSRQPSFADILPIARIAIDEYIRGKYDMVTMVGTDYLSALAQKPRLRTILPITRANLQQVIAETGPARESIDLAKAGEVAEYLFEPSADEVLTAMLIRLVEMQLYQAQLEASASEHAARMLAMRNASDAAEDLITELTLIFNKVRQAGITKDLAEISASRLALTIE